MVVISEKHEDIKVGMAALRQRRASSVDFVKEEAQESEVLIAIEEQMAHFGTCRHTLMDCAE